MMANRTLTRSQVLAWNPDWSDRDRTLVAAALDAVPGQNYEVPPSGGYVGVWVYGPLQARTGDLAHLMNGMIGARSGWHHALKVCRGLLEWPNGSWTDRLDRTLFSDLREDEKGVFDFDCYYQWLPLSTHGRRSPRSAAAREASLRVCPGCHLALPTTRVCDNC